MSQKQIILQALRAAGERGVTNFELNQDLGIFRYSARVHELREQGHTIRTIPETGQRVRFVLEHEETAGSDTRQPLALDDHPSGPGRLFNPKPASPYDGQEAA